MTACLTSSVLPRSGCWQGELFIFGGGLVFSCNLFGNKKMRRIAFAVRAGSRLHASYCLVDWPVTVAQMELLQWARWLLCSQQLAGTALVMSFCLACCAALNCFLLLHNQIQPTSS